MTVLVVCVTVTLAPWNATVGGVAAALEANSSAEGSLSPLQLLSNRRPVMQA